ncbi:MAG: sulfite exporter TauE/SafE family protein [bacterium]|nr:sulfite exporter TauE/SafE family protein [bacterium]
MDLGMELILTLASFITATVSGMVGMAGGVLLLGAMTFFMPLATLVPIHGVVQFVSNISRTLVLAKYVNKRVFVRFLLGVPIGGGLGYWLLTQIARPEWLLGIVGLLLLYVAFKPKQLPPIKLPITGYFFLGLISSCAGSLVGATGPMLAPFFIRDDFSKEEIVSTKAACQILIHIVKFPIFFALGFDYKAYWILLVLMSGGVVLGTFSGTQILKRCSTKYFFILVKVACAIMGGRLILNLL